MENIILIGMPGCGKSTVGQLLARQTGKCFVDADAEIVKSAGMSIPEIFNKQGEAGFRAWETKILQQLGQQSAPDWSLPPAAAALPGRRIIPFCIKTVLYSGCSGILLRCRQMDDPYPKQVHCRICTKFANRYTSALQTGLSSTMVHLRMPHTEFWRNGNNENFSAERTEYQYAWYP